MTLEERKTLVKSYLGKIVDIKIDRPIGYVHKKENYTLTYPINYGYIPGVFGGDGEELDVYLLGVDKTVTEYRAKIIGIVYRLNDVEDKLIAAPEDMIFDIAQITNAIHFQEKYYNTEIEVLNRTHNMKLYSGAFNSIASGNKTIELRLNDDKRQKISVYDNIVFKNVDNNDVIYTTVKALHKFADFKELYKNLPLDKCGYSTQELSTAHYSDMYDYYSQEKIDKYGALGIELCNVQAVCDVKLQLLNEEIYSLLAPSVYNPTKKKLLSRAKKYFNSSDTYAYAFLQDGEYVGIVVFKVKNSTATILDIAVNSNFRNIGIGCKLLDFVLNIQFVFTLVAETDNDAVGFYKKYGFNITKPKVRFGTERYICTYKF